MSQGRTPTARAKLPVAANEAAPPRKNRLREFAGWIVAAILLAGGGTYWLVDRSSRPGPSDDTSVATAPTAVLQQPDVAANTAGAERTAKSRQAHPAPRSIAPPLKVATAGSSAHSNSDLVAAAHAKAARDCKCVHSQIATAAPSSIQSKQSEGTKSSRLAAADELSAQGPKPGTRSEQVHGRVVHVGAFSDVHQAKFVWSNMVRSYPAVAHFEPSLIQNRDWNGKAFYQFQVETASEADSEMLCQSIEKFNYRCAVMGVHATTH